LVARCRRHPALLATDPGRLVDRRRARAGGRGRRLVLQREPIGDRRDRQVPGDLSVVDLRVGDCFDDKDPSADEIEDVKAVPCMTEHEFELFYVGAMGEGSYPTDDAFDTYVTQNCNPAFGAYIGKAYDDSDLDIFSLFPTDDAWRSGDRTVQCAAYHPRIHRLTRSLRGTQQ
jgi:Septum formation